MDEGAHNKLIKAHPSKGYTNFVNHAKTHPNFEMTVQTFVSTQGQDLTKYFGSVTEKAKNIYGWLDFIVMNDLPLCTVERSAFLRHLKLEAIDRKTLDKYLYATQAAVKENIKGILPERFGIITDGWSCDNEHYVAIFATYTTSQQVVVTKLLSCGVQDLPSDTTEAEGFGFTAEDIGDYLFDILQGYNRTFDAVQFISADNAAVNGRLCDLLSQFLTNSQDVTRIVPLVGCASHRLNLAVKSIYEANAANRDLVAQVDDLMKSVNTLKNRPRLSALTPLCPEIRNTTRWGSTFLMLRKYLKLRPFLKKAAFDDDLKAKISAMSGVDKDFEKLTSILEEFNEVSVYLQKESSEVSLSIVRQLFDGLIAETPHLRQYLGSYADIVHDKCFESETAIKANPLMNTSDSSAKVLI